jgi:hypothetical protein
VFVTTTLMSASSRRARRAPQKSFTELGLDYLGLEDLVWR